MYFLSINENNHSAIIRIEFYANFILDSSYVYNLYSFHIYLDYELKKAMKYGRMVLQTKKKKKLPKLDCYQ